MRARPWELFVDPPADGVTNMGVDADLLAALEQGAAPRTVVRFYSWIRPTVSLGRNQREERAVDLDFCSRWGVDVVRRPTGGLAVLHDDEITYAVVSNEPDVFGGGSVYGVYRRVSEALAEGYRRLGVDVTVAPGGSPRSGLSESDQPCFVSQSRYELAVGGRKLVGSAQRRLRRAFLQHGSMPLSVDRRMLAGATRFGQADVLAAEITALNECVRDLPGRETLVAAFAGAMETAFGVTFKEKGPSVFSLRDATTDG